MNHSTARLDAIVEAARATPPLVAAHLKDGRLEGALVLSTCNRVDALVDSEDFPAELVAELGGVEALSGREAVRRVFRVASGLESMVVGEREIAGQLRRAAEVATRAGTMTPSLSRVVQSASAASRRVAAATGLAGRGRSVIEVALAIASSELGGLEGRSAVLVGTGSYAGASVAALRDRGVRDIRVHSASGRAAAFSRGHGTLPIDEDGLESAVTEADVVVACRGAGQPVLTSAQLARAASARRSGAPLLVLDLALDPDVVPEGLPAGIRRIDLAEVAGRLPALERSEVDAAEAVIAEALEAFEREAEGAGAGVGAAVVALRSRVEELVAEEASRLSDLDPEEAFRTERSLRRLAARLVDEPCRRARLAVADGNASGYLEGLDLVLGIRTPEGARP